MSLETRTAPAGDLREAARRQARGVPTALGALVGTLLAVCLVAVFVILDYRLNQAPHRLVKLVVGAGVIVTILMRPRIGLLVIPVVTPFLGWIPVLPVPGMNPLNLLLGSVFFTWALARVLNREPVFRPNQLGGSMALILVLGALSIVRGAAFPTGYYFDAPAAGLELFRSGVTLSVYFIVLAMAEGERDRRRLAWAIVIGLLAEAVVTIAYGRSGSGARAEGSIGQANELGTFLALYAVLAFAMLPGTKNLFGRLLLLASGVAGAYGVILSVSRGSVIALVLGLLYVGFKSSRVLMFLLLATLAVSPWWAPDYLKDRLMGTQVEVEGSDEAELEGSAQLRIDTWKAVITLVTEHPLDGVGFSGLEYVLPETGSSLGIEVKDSAHNTFLRFLGEMGVLGLLALGWLFWKCWRLSVAGMRAATSKFDRQLSVGLAGATLALIVSCAFGDRFFNILITGSFWMLCALVNDLVLEKREAA